jgi:hypothetical protein
MQYTKRLTAAERKEWRRRVDAYWTGNEPALGSVDQRLDIIRRRHGYSDIRLTNAERAELEIARAA